MTKTQTDILNLLLQGYCIASSGAGNFRLRDVNHNPVRKVNGRTFYTLRFNYLRKDKKSGLFFINKKIVRSLHGNTTVKRNYKKILNDGKIK